MDKKEIIVILHDVRSTHNVGSVLRTADGAGVSKVYMTGYTPTPIDRFGRKRGDVSKVSLGAEEIVSWEKREILELIKDLKEKGVQVVAVEQADNSVSYETFKPKFPIAVILGNEVDGISKEILKKVDAVVEIPMYGEKESLNVSVSAGIILYKLR